MIIIEWHFIIKACERNDATMITTSIFFYWTGRLEKDTIYKYYDSYAQSIQRTANHSVVLYSIWSAIWTCTSHEHKRRSMLGFFPNTGVVQDLPSVLI